MIVPEQSMEYMKYDSTIYLTHCGLETPYGNIDLAQNWLKYWLVAWRHQAIARTNVNLSSVTTSYFKRDTSAIKQ